MSHILFVLFKILTGGIQWKCIKISNIPTNRKVWYKLYGTLGTYIYILVKILLQV